MKNYCNKCQLPKASTKSAVIADVYYEHICDDCLAGGIIIPRDGKYKRDREREENAKELIQPFAEGGINRNFAEAYPKQAQSMFGKDKLKESQL